MICLLDGRLLRIPNASLVPAKPPSGYPPCEGRIRARSGYIVAIGLGLRDRLRDRLLGPLAGPDAVAPSSEPSNSTICAEATGCAFAPDGTY